MDINFDAWTKATAELNWGAQNVVFNSLELCAEGKTTLVYGSDYVDGKPCLINSVGPMLIQGDGNGIPSKYFSDLVSEFDRINRLFATEGVNEAGTQFMSPLAAEILLRNFGPRKPEPQPEPIDMAEVAAHEAKQSLNEIIPEISDEDLAESWMQAISVDAVPEDEVREVLDPVKELDEAEGPFYKDEAFVNKYMKY